MGAVLEPRDHFPKRKRIEIFSALGEESNDRAQVAGTGLLKPAAGLSRIVKRGQHGEAIGVYGRELETTEGTEAV